MGRGNPLLASTHVQVALSHMFTMQKGLEIILHHRLKLFGTQKSRAFCELSAQELEKYSWLAVLKGQSQFCQFLEIFPLRTGRSDRPALTNGKRP